MMSSQVRSSFFFLGIGKSIASQVTNTLCALLLRFGGRIDSCDNWRVFWCGPMGCHLPCLSVIVSYTHSFLPTGHRSIEPWCECMCRKCSKNCAQTNNYVSFRLHLLFQMDSCFSCQFRYKCTQLDDTLLSLPHISTFLLHHLTRPKLKRSHETIKIISF